MKPPRFFGGSFRGLVKPLPSPGQAFPAARNRVAAAIGWNTAVLPASFRRHRMMRPKRFIAPISFSQQLRLLTKAAVGRTL